LLADYADSLKFCVANATQNEACFMMIACFAASILQVRERLCNVSPFDAAIAVDRARPFRFGPA
jgi:hypothetical protein